MSPRFDWVWIPALILFVASASLGFLAGTVLAEDWNAVAAERGEIQKACIDGNDRACRVYEARYGR
jgi:hypothetical protein